MRGGVEEGSPWAEVGGEVGVRTLLLVARVPEVHWGQHQAGEVGRCSMGGNTHRTW